MRLSWDRAKNERNLRLRGFGFADAAPMWESPMLIWIDSRWDYGEAREMALGLVDGRVMTVGWVRREDDVFHIFSFRKANARETRRYEDFVTREGLG